MIEENSDLLENVKEEKEFEPGVYGKKIMKGDKALGIHFKRVLKISYVK